MATLRLSLIVIGISLIQSLSAQVAPTSPLWPRMLARIASHIEAQVEAKAAAEASVAPEGADAAVTKPEDAPVKPAEADQPAVTGQAAAVAPEGETPATPQGPEELAAAQKKAAEEAKKKQEEMAKQQQEQMAKQQKQQAIQMAVQQMQQRLQQQPLGRTPERILAARARLALKAVERERNAKREAEKPAAAVEAPDAKAEGQPAEAQPAIEVEAGLPPELAMQLAMEGEIEISPEQLQAMMAMAGGGGRVAPGGAAAPKAIDVEHFFDLLTAGDWTELGSWLKENLDAQAPGIYTAALQALQRNDEVLTPVDIVAIADIAPEETISPGSINSLGGLLARTLARGDAKALLAKLEAGTKWFGGTDRKARDRAADLLIAANLLGEAKAFLQPLTEGVPGVSLLMRHGNHARYMAEQAKRTDLARTHYIEAFELWQRAADHENVTSGERRQAIAQQLEIVGHLPEELAADWRETLFVNVPESGLAALADLARGLERQLVNPRQGGWVPPESPDQLRRRSRTLYSLAAEIERLLKVSADDLERWDLALELLARSWQAEVVSHIKNQGPSFASQDNSDDGEVYWGRQMPRAISAEELYAARPSLGWMERLDAGLLADVLTSVARLSARLGEDQAGMEAIRELKAIDKERALAAANAFVDDFRLSLNPGTEAYGSRQVYYVNGMRQVFYTGGSGSEKPPITRTQQVTGLALIESFVKALKAEGVGPLDHKTLLNTFAACHSAAEVYRRQDVQAIFGEIAAMEAALASEMAARMRLNLAERWRKPEVQRQAGTRRTGPEILSEVRRGYELALELATGSSKAGDNDPGRIYARGLLRYDFSAFLENQKAPLDQYDSLRKGAFADFRSAALAYADAVQKDQHPITADYYAAWFLASLGATDVAYIARNSEQDEDEIARLFAAIEALPADLQEAHRGALAEFFEQVGKQAPAVIKPRFVRHALRLVGSHPKARGLARIGKIYDEVAREVELSLRLDGASTVGHKHFFGLRIALRYTTALERETGGFSRYLQNNYYNGNVQVNYRNDFEKFVRDALKDRFKIENFVFHDESDPTRWFGRSGWVELPLAYVVLQALEPSVDQIPAIPFDMDFQDGQGTAIIPITSEPVLIDAATPLPPVRPVQDLEVDYVLDDRALAESGALFLEVRLKGKGVLPAPDQIADFALKGYELTRIEEHGTNIVELDEDSSESLPKSERSFTVHWKAQSDATDTFRYPALKVEGKMQTRRYADRDITDVNGLATLARTKGKNVAQWWYALLLIPLLAAIGFVATRPRGPLPPSPHAPPAAITPLSALHWLNQLEARSEHWNETDLQSLRKDIAALERAHFAKAAPNDAEDAAAVIQRWSSRA